MSISLTIADLQKDILSSSAKVLEKLDILTGEVGAINKRIDEVEKSVEFASSRISAVEKNIPKVKTGLQKK